jgi:hypothetical protein
MKIKHAQAKREMNARYLIELDVGGNELPLREDSPMIG